MSRWLQLPLYLGLIVAQGVYVWQFWVEIVHLIQAASGDSTSAQAVIASVTPPGAAMAAVDRNLPERSHVRDMIGNGRH